MLKLMALTVPSIPGAMVLHIDRRSEQVNKSGPPAAALLPAVVLALPFLYSCFSFFLPPLFLLLLVLSFHPSYSYPYSRPYFYTYSWPPTPALLRPLADFLILVFVHVYLCY